jgi:DNA-binding MarR family transcriptional regulator
MTGTEFQSHSGSSHPIPDAKDGANGGSSDLLQTLLNEVVGLANQLRRMAAAVPDPPCSQVGGWGVLQLLERQGPLTVPSIARYRTVSRQSTQTLVNRLASQGWVASAPNPAHKRSGLVQLTDDGRRALAAATTRESPSSATLLPHVPESRLISATRLLRKVREAFAVKRQPSVEPAVTDAVHKRATKPPKRTDRRKPEPPRADSPNQSEPAMPEESEFPLSLL